MKTSISKRVAENEKRYRFLTNFVLDSLWVIDAETMKFLFISEMTRKLRGYSSKEVMGTGIKSIMTPESYRNAMELYEKARREYEQGKDPSYKLEIEAYHKDCTTVWIEISAKFVKEEGEPLQLVGISRDITDRKLAQMNKDHLLKMYKEALAEQKRLKAEIELVEKLLPICSGCRRIRDENNNWWPLEEYIRQKARAKITHTICQDCTKVYYPDSVEEEQGS